MSRSALRAFAQLGLPVSLREEAETIERVTTWRIERDGAEPGLAWRVAFDQLRDEIVERERRRFRAASAETFRRKALVKQIAERLREGLRWMVGQTNDSATRERVAIDARRVLGEMVCRGDEEVE